MDYRGLFFFFNEYIHQMNELLFDTEKIKCISSSNSLLIHIGHVQAEFLNNDYFRHRRVMPKVLCIE